MTTAPGLRTYKKDKIRLQHNNKTGEAGTIDVFRGCQGCEMKNAPCYAAKGAARCGIDFFQPIRREFDKSLLEKQLKRYDIDWVRIGCISDPSLDWKITSEVAQTIRDHGKTPVIITKVYKQPLTKTIKELAKAKAMLQISVCGLTPRKELAKREDLATKALSHVMRTSIRINSAIWKSGSKPEQTQKDLVLFAKSNGLRILDTPLRIFQTSPFWNHVEQEKYHRHLSPISGKLDNQRTAGLIIPKAYPCYSTCAKGPTGNDPIGCSHQCLTKDP